VEILDAGQIATVLDALKGDRLYPIVVLAIATGMRRGELLALQWRDVDLDRGALRVERSLEQTRAGSPQGAEIETRKAGGIIAGKRG
jgi:integrase